MAKSEKSSDHNRFRWAMKNGIWSRTGDVTTREVQLSASDHGHVTLTTDTELPLDLEIGWAILPPKLQSAVLGKLPIRERARARRVCRAWKDCLDTDRQLWSEICGLAIVGGTLKTLEVDWRRSAARWNSQKAKEDTLGSAIAFFALHCQLTTFKLANVAPWETGLLEKIFAAADLTGKLRCLLAYAWTVPRNEVLDIRHSLAQFIQNQPKLELLVLGPFSISDDADYKGDFELALLGALNELHCLRVLVLHLPHLPTLCKVPGSVLAGLDYLSVGYDCIWDERFNDFGEEEKDEALTLTAQSACRHVKKWGKSLVYRQHRQAGRGSYIYWSRQGELAGRAHYGGYFRDLNWLSFLNGSQATADYPLEVKTNQGSAVLDTADT